MIFVLHVGDITVRTHTSKRVVNKLSRFHTTAGMESFSHSHSQSQNLHNSVPLGHAQSSAAASSSASSPPRMDPREFPSSCSASPGLQSAINSVAGLNGWNNPRSLPLPSPVSITALQQVKQPYLTNSKWIWIVPLYHGLGNPVCLIFLFSLLSLLYILCMRYMTCTVLHMMLVTMTWICFEFDNLW